MVDKEPKQIDPTLRKLYPNFSDNELIEAEDNLDAYLEIVIRIFERIKNDPEEYARFKKRAEELKARRPDPDPPHPSELV